MPPACTGDVFAAASPEPRVMLSEQDEQRARACGTSGAALEAPAVAARRTTAGTSTLEAEETQKTGML